MLLALSPAQSPRSQILETGFLQRQGYEARRDEEVKAGRDDGFAWCRDRRTCTCRRLEQQFSRARSNTKLCAGSG
jgi:hypothetical protein